MNYPFGESYAQAYDAIYRTKAYIAEVDLIERILARHGLEGPRHLLDLGRGTGSHVIPLASRGHIVVGVDRSTSMLAQARAKAATLPTVTELYESDIRTLDLKRQFDAVLMMFAVLGYQQSDADVQSALHTVRRHLGEGGIFIFDVWNGLAVLRDRPGRRQVTVQEGAARFNRKTHAVLDESRHVCRVLFDLERIDEYGQAEQWQEEHVMRYYFPAELGVLLRESGLELLSLRGFPDEITPVDHRTWNMIGVAQAR
jgi:SAM-dependent methyltransferase